MFILVQFLLRLAFGMALAMALTSPRQVTSGYYRNHAYVLLGLTALASLVAWSRAEVANVWFPLVAAIASYVASAAWLYEQRRMGMAALLVTSLASLAGAWSGLARSTHSALAEPDASGLRWLMAACDPLASGWLLGTVIAAMLLGHWYLNAPGMQLAPLRRLIALIASGVALRGMLSAAALICEARLGAATEASAQSWTLLSLRWGAGIAGVAMVAWMANRTLDVPNTQSATGILYVAVIFSFLGELAGLLLSAAAQYPL